MFLPLSSSETSLESANPPSLRRASLPIILEAPTSHRNVQQLPIPRVSLHALHLSPLRLPHISRPNLLRRNSEPPDFKIECTSGPRRRTHAILSTCTSSRHGPIRQRDIFVCSNGVNGVRLLGLSREAMSNQIKCRGGNAMVDEGWSYTIQPCKSGQESLFKVSITYFGMAAQCDRPDPHIPIAIEEAKGIPGLMTVLSRE